MATPLIRLEARPAPGQALCRLDDMAPAQGLLRVLWFDWEGPQRLLLIRDGAEVLAYYNECPHQLVSLDGPDGGFFDADGRHLMCSFHGARFRPDDGLCVSGPPAGRRLRRFPIEVRDGRVRAARPGNADP